MFVKLFILGFPGSGKSTISHHITDYIGERQWSTTHIHDYDILSQMFREDKEGQFEKTDHGGFNVVHMPVLDTALEKLEQKVKAHLSAAQFENMVLIEFSRNDYEVAFSQFSQEFLADAYFLYLNVERKICKERLRERTARQNTPNDHYVSEDIFDSYYYGDDGQELPHTLKRKFRIDSLKVKIIDNNISQEDFSILNDRFWEIERFIDYIIANEAHGLQETEPIQKIKDMQAQGELERN